MRPSGVAINVPSQKHRGVALTEVSLLSAVVAPSNAANTKSVVTGLAFTGGDGTDDATMTFSGNLVFGAAATYLIFDGITASTLGGNFTQVVFDFKLSPALIIEGVLLALIVGLIGGFFPAIRAARLPIVSGLYAS